MIYLRYEFRWKDYKSLRNLSKDTKSEFEIKYLSSDIRSINEQFYNDFLKKEEYIACISGVTESKVVRVRERMD